MEGGREGGREGGGQEWNEEGITRREVHNFGTSLARTADDRTPVACPSSDGLTITIPNLYVSVFLPEAEIFLRDKCITDASVSHVCTKRENDRKLHILHNEGVHIWK